MEAKWIAVTAVAPVSWGANYVVTREWLPADSPLWGSALRALPAGLLLLAFVRRLPHGRQARQAVILGVLNVGGFFLLVYLAAQLLPSNIAASVMSLAPLALAGFGWLLLGDRPTVQIGLGAVAGVLGVVLLVGGASGHIAPAGVAVSLSALVLSSIGAILATRWRGDVPVLTYTAWQLLAGGVLLAVLAGAIEGAPPAMHPDTVAALTFNAVVATALAYVCWFTGLANLRAGVVGTVGTLNPITGIVLGAVIAGESLTAAQFGGIALTLGGIAIVARRQRVRRGPSTPPAPATRKPISVR